MSEQRKQAWQTLVDAAAFAVKHDFERAASDGLSTAAKAWAQANGYVSAVGGAPAVHNDGAVFPNYGRSKGQPVRGASVQDLEFYAKGCRRTLADESKSRWHDKERQLLAAIEAELETR